MHESMHRQTDGIEFNTLKWNYIGPFKSNSDVIIANRFDETLSDIRQYICTDI